MKNEEHYTRVSIERADRDNWNVKKMDWWRVLWIALALIFFFPFLPRRHRHLDDYPTTGTEYLNQLVLPTIITVVIVIFLLWKSIIKPSLNKRRGYILRGQFEVINKINQFGQTKLKLQPGTGHSIGVDKQLYKFINIGDKVLVERSAMGEIIKVKKI